MQANLSKFIIDRLNDQTVWSELSGSSPIILDINSYTMKHDISNDSMCEVISHKITDFNRISELIAGILDEASQTAIYIKTCNLVKVHQYYSSSMEVRLESLIINNISEIDIWNAVCKDSAVVILIDNYIRANGVSPVTVLQIIRQKVRSYLSSLRENKTSDKTIKKFGNLLLIQQYYSGKYDIFTW